MTSQVPICCSHHHLLCRPSVNPKYLTPSEVREVMRRMWALNEPILAYIYPTGEL